MLWLPGSGVVGVIEKGSHDGTALCLVALSCQVRIKHCLRRNWKPLFLILLGLCILLPLWKDFVNQLNV